MRILFCAIFLFLKGICNATSQIIYLSELNGTNAISGIEEGANLFLASRDKIIRLASIRLISGNNNITLDKLYLNINDNGTRKPWKLSKELTIINENYSSEELSGLLYITSASQANDNKFDVYVVRDNTTISIDEERTIVFLNLMFGNESTNEPKYHSRIENLKQENTTKLTMYYSIPNETYLDLDSPNTTQYKIFENPLKIDDNTKNIFFYNVETLQIPTVAWYLHATGGINCTINTIWDDSASSNTTAVTTTGLITNGLHTIQNEVNFDIDASHNRSTGVVINANFTTYINISMLSDTSASYVSYLYSQHLTYTSDISARKMIVSPSTEFAGFYYIQYFGIDGIPLPTTEIPTTTTTAPTNSTTTSVYTTTNTSTTPLYTFLSLILMIIYFST